MFQIRFAGLTLDGILSWEEAQASRVNVNTFPRKHGGIVVAVPFKAPKSGTFSFAVIKDSEAALTAYLDNLRAVLDAGVGQLFLRDDNRYVRVVKTNFSLAHRASDLPALKATGAIEFVAADPFFYDATGEQHADDLAVTASPSVFAANNTGGAVTPVRIEIKANGADKTGTFKLTNTTTGIYAQYTGTINNGNFLLIDGADFTVTINGTNGLKNFVGSFWQLALGNNNLNYEGPTGVDVKVYWRKRWN